MVKAAKRFDETRGFKFISYAVWWIRQSILQALSKKSRIIRLPQNKIAVSSKIYQVLSTLEQENERPPSASEIAKELDMSVSKVKNSLKSSGKSISLDAPFKEGESSSLYNILESSKLNSPDKNVMAESLETDINQVLKKIPERQGDVLRLFFGLGNQPAMSLVEIGEVFDVTRERVRQIKNKGLRSLRRASNTEVLRAYL